MQGRRTERRGWPADGVNAVLVRGHPGADDRSVRRRHFKYTSGWPEAAPCCGGSRERRASHAQGGAVRGGSWGGSDRLCAQRPCGAESAASGGEPAWRLSVVARRAHAAPVLPIPFLPFFSFFASAVPWPCMAGGSAVRSRLRARRVRRDGVPMKRLCAKGGAMRRWPCAKGRAGGVTLWFGHVGPVRPRLKLAMSWLCTRLQTGVTRCFTCARAA